MKDCCGKLMSCPGCGKDMPTTEMKNGVCSECKLNADLAHSPIKSTLSNLDLFGEP